MAVAGIPETVDRVWYSEVDLAPNLSVRSSGSEREIVEEVKIGTTPSLGFREEMMYVALGKDVKEGERILMWALRNSRGMKICILHIHLPAQKIPVLGTKIPINMLQENQVKAYREIERQDTHKIIDKYIQICERSGVRAKRLCREMDSIEKGIVQLIFDHEIKWLVMGAAAGKYYSRRMKEPKSNKAIHVCSEAPTFCQIWFICKGNCIYTRERAGDCISCMAVMLELARGVAQWAHGFKKAVTFLCNTGEDEGSNVAQHPWSGTVRTDVDPKALGIIGKSCIFQVRPNGNLAATDYS